MIHIETHFPLLILITCTGRVINQGLVDSLTHAVWEEGEHAACAQR